MQYSCTDIYAHSCLKPLSNQLRPFFKQLSPCSNHAIHMLFEHGFYLKIFKMGHRLFTWSLNDNARLPRNKYFVLIFVDLNAIAFFAEWRQTEQNKMVSTDVLSAFKDFFRCLRQEFSWNYIQCKNNDHTCLFHCINICQVHWKKFEHLAFRPRVQITSLGSGKY